MTLIATLIGIAILDSLNPSLFIAQFYLFTTTHPAPRIASYIAGVLTANFVGGLLLLTGVGTLLANLVREIPLTWAIVLQLGLGFALLAAGLWYRAVPQEKIEVSHKPRSGGLLGAFAFGIVVMGNELTTALPYFVAIERIVEAQLSAVSSLLALGLYNLIFAIPLIAFLFLFIRYRQRFTTQLERINAWMRMWTPRIVKGTMLLVGFGLAVNALRLWMNV